MIPHINLWRILSFITLAGLISGCSGIPTVQQNQSIALPTPTANQIFSKDVAISSQSFASGQTGQSGNDPAIGNGFGYFSSSTITFPTRTPYPTATWLPAQPTPQTVEIPIYTDSLRAGWEVVSPSNEMTFSLKGKEHVHSGTYAIPVNPQKGHGKIYIVSGPDNPQVYPRNDIVGVRLWIYSGERGLDQYDLALTAIGSNQYTYWRADDDSVMSKTPYEETFLRWFGYDQNIPPFTWAEITIWLNEMRFDPDYQYLTGLYITNRQGFTRTFYVDDVSLLLAPGVELPTPNPVQASTSTEMPGTTTPAPTATKTPKR